MSVADRVRASLSLALASMGMEELARGATYVLERPKRPEHGDLATNVAMVLTKKAGKPPRAIAEALVSSPTSGAPAGPGAAPPPRPASG
ncbi:MAG: hypothetical protein ABSE49_11250 [Polyangiaceae bacterium]